MPWTRETPEDREELWRERVTGWHAGPVPAPTCAPPYSLSIAPAAARSKACAKRSAYSPTRWFVDRGLAQGVGTDALRARTITLYTDVGKAVRELGLPGTDTIGVLLVDQSGRISPASVNGGFDGEKLRLPASPERSSDDPDRRAGSSALSLVTTGGSDRQTAARPGAHAGALADR